MEMTMSDCVHRQLPILFNGEMVRAILAGRKTQTRRPFRYQPFNEEGVRGTLLGPDWYNPIVVNRHDEEEPGPNTFGVYSIDGIWSLKSPYVPGDLLYVRETWATDVPIDEAKRQAEDVFGTNGVYFRADLIHENTGLTWRPSIHMPKWASRIWLRVTDVRVERVQEITPHDALKEGVIAHPYVDDCPPDSRLVKAFGVLWELAYPGSWDRNDWIWVYEFKRVNNPNE